MVKRRVWPGIVVSLLCVIFLALPPASGTSHASFPFTPTQTTAPSASASEGPAAGNPTLYGNTTVELPGFECYGEYQNKPGGANDCQTPILSWTQDGVYYVNATSVLVFYSFANSTVYGIHPWTMLWQRFPSYDMIPNELFITQDGTYVYSWGTLTKNSTTITGEAVNVSTDRIFEHNFTGVNTSNYTTNGQISMIGFDGNDSWMSLIEASAHILAYNIWSGVQSHGPVLGFFEANNVYWMPYLNAYVNVEAQGSSRDGVEEWRMYSPGGELYRTYSGTWSTGCEMEGVNGLAYNVTSHLLYFSGGAGGAAGCGPTGGNNLVWYHVDPATGNLTSAAGHLPIAAKTDWAVASDGYRNSLVSDGPLYAGGFFTSNDSFLFSPPDTFAPTNASPWIRNNHDGEEAWETWYADGAFFNTTYFMPATAAACPGNYDSDTFGSACSVNGTSYPQGTVWYRWKIGQPEWPYPANSAIAQTAAPSAVAENATALSDTSVKFSWSTPADYAQPIVNWTFEYTLAGEPTSYLSLWGQNRSVTLTGLPRSVRVTYCVQATNLHWTGPCTPRSILTEERFSVQFSETGLPVGEGWWVNLSDGETLDSTNASFTVTEPNGTYGYTLATGDKVYAPTVTSGSFLVWGAGADERVIFDPVTYAITFTERGLPSNFEWWVTISGSTREGPNLRQFSNSTSLSFDVSNGSYSFIIGVTAGYTTNLTLGGVKLNGGPAQLTIVFRSPPGADTLFGLPRTEAYSILGAVAAGVILIGVAVLGLRRRRKPPAHAVVSPSSLGETPPHGLP